VYKKNIFYYSVEPKKEISKKDRVLRAIPQCISTPTTTYGTLRIPSLLSFSVVTLLVLHQEIVLQEWFFDNIRTGSW
jgi:hypothetical protein